MWKALFSWKEQKFDFCKFYRSWCYNEYTLRWRACRKQVGKKNCKLYYYWKGLYVSLALNSLLEKFVLFHYINDLKYTFPLVYKIYKWQIKQIWSEMLKKLKKAIFWNKPHHFSETSLFEIVKTENDTLGTRLSHRICFNRNSKGSLHFHIRSPEKNMTKNTSPKIGLKPPKSHQDEIGYLFTEIILFWFLKNRHIAIIVTMTF